METEEVDRVKSLEMLRELQTGHKSIKNNPELQEIQKKIDLHRKKDENLRYKNPVDQDILQVLRQKFQNSLNKLNSIDTREFALKEAKSIIERNNSLELLKVYISSLSELRKSKSSSARQLEVSLLGYLSEIYKENLIEEITPLKTLIRIAELIQSYFKDLNRKVHESAASALCSLYKFSLPKSNQQIIFAFMFDPLNSILASGIDVQVQQAAALTIYTWAAMLVEEKDQGNLLALYGKVLGLFLKLRAEFVDLLNTLGLLIDTCGYDPLMDSLPQFLSKIQQYLRHPSANSHLLKISACKLLNVAGKHLTEIAYRKLDPFPAEILAALREIRTEKMPVVQAAARESLRVWEIYQGSLCEQPVQLSPIGQSPRAYKRIDPESHFKVIRNLVKIQKEKSKAAEVSTSKEENPWGFMKAGFLKKGSGNYMVLPAQGQVNIARALENRPSIKEYVKKNKSISPTDRVEIRYKKDSKILEYERDPSPKMFEVQKDSATNSALPVNFNERRNEKKRQLSQKKGEESGEREEYNILESRENNIEVGEKNMNEEENEIEQEENDNIGEFQGFIRLNTEATSISREFVRQSMDNQLPRTHNSPLSSINEENNSKAKLSGEKLSQSEGPVITGEKHDYLTADPLKPDIKPNIVDGDHTFLKPLASSGHDKDEIEHRAPISASKSEIESKKLKPGEEPKGYPSRFSNKVEIMESQNIEIKPSQNPLKKPNRSILIRNCSIEHQPSLKISKAKSRNLIEPSSSSKNLKIEKLDRLNVKGIISKEVQTSLDFPDTPRFSHEFKSHIYKVQQDPYQDYYSDILQEQAEEIQKDFERSFTFITQELSKVEERLDWISETSACLKQYKIIKRQVSQQNSLKSRKQVAFKSISTQSEQPRPSLDKLPADLLPKALTNKANDRSEYRKESQVAEYNDYLTAEWTRVLQLIKDGDLAAAFSAILQTGDDIYLLRTMFKTGPCLDLLPDRTAEMVMKKLVGVLRSRFIENMGLQWVVEAWNGGLIEEQEYNDVVELGNALQNVRVKGGEEGREAIEIYNLFAERFRMEE